MFAEHDLDAGDDNLGAVLAAAAAGAFMPHVGAVGLNGVPGQQTIEIPVVDEVGEAERNISTATTPNF